MRTWRWILPLGLLAAAAGAWLARATVASYALSQRLGLPAAVDAATVVGRGRYAFEGLRIAQPQGFGTGHLFQAARLRLAPDAALVEGAVLDVVVAHGGGDNLAALPPGLLRAHPSDFVLRLEDVRIAVTERQSGATQHLEITRGEVAWEHGVLTRVDATGESAGPAGGGPLRIDWRPGEGALRVRCTALELGPLAFLLRALGLAERASGLLDLDVEAELGGGRLRLAGEGTARAFDWQGGLLDPGAGIADSHVRLSGAAELDAHLLHAEFQGFSFQSSWLELSADGVFRAGAERLCGAGRATLGLNFDLLSRRAPGLVVDASPVRGGGGVLSAEAIASDTGIEVSATSHELALAFEGGRTLHPHDATLHARLDVAPDLSAIHVHDVALQAYPLGLTGGARWRRGDSGWALEHARFRVEAELARVEQALGRWCGGTQVRGAGEFTLDVEHERLEDGERWRGELRSQDVDVRLVRPAGPGGSLGEDEYFFRGMPVEARATWVVPDSRAIAAIDATLAVRASSAVVRDDPVEDFVCEAVLADGVARTTRWSGRVREGDVRASVRVDLRESPPAIALEVAGEGLLPKGHAAELSGQLVPVFCAENGPWRVLATTRVSGSLRASGRGHGLREFALHAQGEGDVEWNAGTIEASPFLDAVLGAAGAHEVEGLSARVTLADGRIESLAQLSLPGGRSIASRGHCDWWGRLDFDVPPAELFSPALIAAHGEALAQLRFGVDGHYLDPRVHVPDVPLWERLAREGNLAAAIAAFAVRP